ncbi:MAG: hypothetical protein RMK98_05940 [Bacteroidia bacterium]|nr:hypothetical protein [Bacteroidia bacterium]
MGKNERSENSETAGGHGGLSSWGKWSLWAGVMTLLYLPLTLNKRDLLYQSPIEKAKCMSDEYCRANLVVLPIRLIAPHGDVWTYLGPIDYLFSQGRYWEDYRMPGYGAIYGLFRLITGSREVAIWLVFLSQFLTWSLALGLLANDLSKRGIKDIFIFGLLVLLCFSPPAYYVRVIGSESFSISLGILSILSLLHKRYGLSGLLATAVFFMRPVHIVWIFTGALYILWTERRLKPAVFFIVPFLSLEGAWIWRNYVQYGDFRPFHGNKLRYYSYIYSRYDRYVIELSRYLWHGYIGTANRGATLISTLLCQYPDSFSVKDIALMVPTSIARGLCAPETLHSVARLACELKYSPTYSPASPESVLYGKKLVTLKNFILDFNPSPEDCKKELEIESKLQQCLLEAKRYYQENPTAYLRTFVSNLLGLDYMSTGYDRVSSAGRLKLKVLYYDIYKWIYLLGLLVAAYYLVRGSSLKRLLSLYAISVLGVYLILRLMERRYMETVAPYFLVSLCIGIADLLEKIKLPSSKSAES